MKRIRICITAPTPDARYHKYRENLKNLTLSPASEAQKGTCAHTLKWRRSHIHRYKNRWIKYKFGKVWTFETTKGNINIFKDIGSVQNFLWIVDNGSQLLCPCLNSSRLSSFDFYCRTLSLGIINFCQDVCVRLASYAWKYYQKNLITKTFDWLIEQKIHDFFALYQSEYNVILSYFILGKINIHIFLKMNITCSTVFNLKRIISYILYIFNIIFR